MKKYLNSIIITIIAFVVTFVVCHSYADNYRRCDNIFIPLPTNSEQNAISKCIEKLNKKSNNLTERDVAVCYYKNMKNSSIEGSTVKDQCGYNWNYTIKGKCKPDDECKAHVSNGKSHFDIFLWYDMSGYER